MLRHPICIAKNCTSSGTAAECRTAPSNHVCTLHYIHEVSGNLPTRSIQIKRADPMQLPSANATTNTNMTTSCSNACDSKIFVQYQNYCIPRVLMKDFLSYDQFRPPQILEAITNNAYTGMEYLLFFCHTMKLSTACEHLANLCVLSMYSLDRYSPCSLFFATQSTITTSDGTLVQKTVPFLFFTKGKSSLDELEKVIDYRYGYDRENYSEVCYQHN